MSSLRCRSRRCAGFCRGAVPGAKSTTGSVPIVPPLTARKRPYFDEMSLAHPLDHKLGDPVPASDGEGLLRVGVEQVDQDLAAVTRVHRPGRIQHSDAVPCSKPGAGVYERDIPGGEGNGDTCANKCPMPRSEDHILPGVKIRSGVARMGVDGYREIGVKARDQHPDPRGVSHGHSPMSLCRRHEAEGAPLRQHTRGTPAGP